MKKPYFDSSPFNVEVRHGIPPKKEKKKRIHNSNMVGLARRKMWESGCCVTLVCSQAFLNDMLARRERKEGREEGLFMLLVFAVILVSITRDYNMG